MNNASEEALHYIHAIPRGNGVPRNVVVMLAPSEEREILTPLAALTGT